MKQNINLLVVLLATTALLLGVISVSAAQTFNYTFYAKNGTATNVTDDVFKLTIPGNLTMDDSWAKVKWYYTLNLSELDQFSFDYKITTGRVTPYIVLELDTDANNHPDIWITQHPQNVSDAVSYGTWYTYSRDKWQYNPGGEGNNWTLNNVKTNLSGEILGIKVAIGYWSNIDPHEVYVTNMSINDVLLTELEPEYVPPDKKQYRRSGSSTPRDADGDGYSDTNELLAGTDANDPCDPNPECAACLAIRPPTPTPESTVTPTLTPEPTFPSEPTLPEPIPEPIIEETKGKGIYIIVGVVALIVSLLVIFMYLRYRYE